ncbi:MAG: HAMP domain-containing sensor histidine kinase [Patulibacter minatonensis]
MSARARLTLSYAAFVVVAGTGFMAVSWSVLRFVPYGNLSGTAVGAPRDGTPQLFVPDRGALLDVFLPRSLVMLGLLAVVGLVGGWILAGHMLRPLDRIHAVAEQVAQGSLDHRVRLTGPHDEFRLLADTFDGMLDRMQAAFEEQRRFAANASHELRTPYAISRTLLDVAIADPAGRDVDELLRRLDETNRRGLDVVEEVLALASLDHAEAVATAPVDIAELAADVVRELGPLAEEHGIALETVLGEGDVDGNATLIRQLLVNLVQNAIRHNTGPGGRVDLRTGTTIGDHVDIGVSNSGPVVPPEIVATLTEPFVRGAGRVAAGPAGRGSRGSGLGLAIVARVAAVHHAELDISARSVGGLDVLVRFPPVTGA